MVSRRKILSRSRDDLNTDQQYVPEDEEDVWYQKDKLFKEHIQEVLDKWDQIDDEIWAKIIVFEGNRRVAKAYARAPILTINNSDESFDGMRIGLCGFENPMRSPKTGEVKRQIGQGVKIKMDDAGNILIRRYSRSNVYVKSTANSSKDETAIGNEILKLPNQALEIEKIAKLFDVKKFQSNINRELKQAYPDRRRLELQCLSAISFVRTETDVLDCPIWVLVINVVAMDMLKSKMPLNDLNLEHQYQQQDEEEDVWYQKDKLYKSTVWCIRLNLLMQIVSIIFVPARAIHFVDELQELQELNGDNRNVMATTIAVNILAMIFAVLVICNVLLSHWIIEEEKTLKPPNPPNPQNLPKTERLYPRIPAPKTYLPNNPFFETRSRIMASAPIYINSYKSDTDITYHDCEV